MAAEAEMLLREAEDRIEQWLCELDASWGALLADAEADAEQIRSDALADADEVVAAARLEADGIIAAAHAKAGEHADVIRALAAAEREAAGEELVSLREAVARLRHELSHLMDAAFDALPAVEATAEAIDRALDDEVMNLTTEPDVIVIQQAPRRGFLRRLLHR